MLRYVGNCSDIIDWNEVINQIKDMPPAYVGPRHRATDIIPGLEEVSSVWHEAGYKTIDEGGNASWDMYFPGTQFDISVVERFAEFVNIDLDGTYYCWISRVKPGCVAPWHWDVTDDEGILSNTIEPKRFHTHIIPSQPGHALFVEDQCLWNQSVGDTFQWSSRKSWHAGSNAGKSDKYLFNFWR